MPDDVQPAETRPTAANAHAQRMKSRGFSGSATSYCRLRFVARSDGLVLHCWKTKKADVAEHLKVFTHVGLLLNGLPTVF